MEPRRAALPILRRGPAAWIAALVLGLALTGVSGAAETQARAGVEVTYLANEGFLIAAGDARVLVDALFGDGLAGYETVPAATRRELEAASGSFAGVDLVLASHHHGDHFDPRAVARHLENNPGARFVSTRQAVERLRRVAGFERFADRVEGHWPAEGETAAVEHAGIRVTVLNLHHGRDRRPPVQNLGFLIEIGGLRLLHVGDTEVTVEDVRPYALGDAGVDVFFAPAWTFTYDVWRPVLAEVGARARVVMHLAAEGAPAGTFGPDGTRAKRLERIRAADPDAIVLETLETRRFD